MEDKKKKDIDLDEVEELDEDIDFEEIDNLDEEDATANEQEDDEDDLDFDDEDEEDEEDVVEETKESEKEIKKSKDDNKEELLDDEGESFGAKIVIAIVIIAIIIILLLKACVGKKEQFKVTFDTNGGTTVENLMVDKDGTVKRPKDPTKEGYTFAGWYYNDELYDFNTKVTGNIKLIAKWEASGKVTGVTLNETAVSLKPGATMQLVATVKPDSAEDKSLTWSSSDESIVTVDENGNIKAVKNGTATITVTTKDGGYKATVKVTVTEDDIAVTGVSFDSKTLNLATGSSTTLKATVSPSDATNKNVTWSSSDPSIATVDGNGKVTGKKEGTVTITVTTKDGNKTATITVTVKDEPVKSVKIDGKTSMYVNDTQTLRAVITPNNASNKEVTWSSSDSSVATVDKNGKVTAKKAGTATITVTTKDGGKTATIKITVADRKVTKVTVTGKNEMIVDNTIKLTAKVEPSTASNKKVTWSSSDESIATVDANGNVTAKKVGKVTITATSNDNTSIKDSITITIKDHTYRIVLKPSVIDEINKVVTQYSYTVYRDNVKFDGYNLFRIDGSKTSYKPGSGNVDSTDYAGTTTAKLYLPGEKVTETGHNATVSVEK